MNSNWKLLPAALLVAVLAMAGCGGGGSDDTTPTPPEQPTEPAPPASVEQLSLDIQAAENMAIAANKMATDALASAKANSEMLTTAEVGGESGVAMKAAMDILEAEMDIGTALMNAEAALEAAEDAQTSVMALPDDHPHKGALTTTVDRVVMDVGMYVDMVKAINDGTELEDYVVLVEGDDGDRTARDIANIVGGDIAGALASGTGALTRARGTHAAARTAFDAATDDAVKVDENDAKGMYWEDIVEDRGGSVMTMPIGTDNAGVKVASVAGMDVNMGLA